MTRRGLLVDLGRVSLGVVVLGMAACAADAEPGADPSDGGEPPQGSEPPLAGSDRSAARWARADAGNVSAWVLIRGGESVIVDTGNPGDEGLIEAVLTEAGLGWNSVADVILTHRHGDHIGSVPEVLAAASSAAAWAGADDIPAITAPRQINVAEDRATISGLTVIATPGHTPGHICLHDTDRSVLVAGDAINGTDGSEVLGPNPQYTPDMVMAEASARRLGELTFDQVLFGHGEPVLSGADEALASYLATQGS